MYEGYVIAQCCFLPHVETSRVTTSNAFSVMGLCGLVFSLSYRIEDSGLSSASRYEHSDFGNTRDERFRHIGRIKGEENTSKTIVVVL